MFSKVIASASVIYDPAHGLFPLYRNGVPFQGHLVPMAYVDAKALKSPINAEPSQKYAEKHRIQKGHYNDRDLPAETYDILIHRHSALGFVLTDDPRMIVDECHRTRYATLSQRQTTTGIIHGYSSIEYDRNRNTIYLARNYNSLYLLKNERYEFLKPRSFFSRKIRPFVLSDPDLLPLQVSGVGQAFMAFCSYLYFGLPDTFVRNEKFAVTLYPECNDFHDAKDYYMTRFKVKKEWGSQVLKVKRSWAYDTFIAGNGSPRRR